jgi:riboflavin kinase/FMN adenylyltransferase
MQLFRGIYNVPSNFSGCAATIGNFDGVTLGHKQVLSRLKEVAIEKGLPTLVIIFEPQPREFFSPNDALARLTNFSEKYTLLKKESIDYVLCLSFNLSLKNKTAQHFIDDILCNGLKAKHLIVGDDFRFGCDRKGDFNFLRSYSQSTSKEKTFTVENSPTYTLEGERISSTRIRQALLKDDLDCVERCLGRRMSLTGRVAYGQQIGRTLNMPTANILLKRQKLIMQGVYAVTILGIDQNHVVYKGVANIGLKPTLENLNPPPSLEVHVLDYQGNLYGQRLTVLFYKKLRNEKKFEDLNALKLAIHNDQYIAKEYFNTVDIPQPYSVSISD